MAVIQYHFNAKKNQQFQKQKTQTNERKNEKKNTNHDHHTSLLLLFLFLVCFRLQNSGIYFFFIWCFHLGLIAFAQVHYR